MNVKQLLALVILLVGGTLALACQTGAQVASAAAIDLVTDCPTLKQGSTGPCVKELQRRLNDSGASALAIDGIAGPQTARAIRIFQEAHPPLAVDGVAGPETKNVLMAVTAHKPLWSAPNPGGDVVNHGLGPGSGDLCLLLGLWNEPAGLACSLTAD
jgi:peptidoglycan hydrolase-like protein with peptidoglycan-binding domain